MKRKEEEERKRKEEEEKKLKENLEENPELAIKGKYNKCIIIFISKI